ncbi:hypothetical protein O3M35_010584 [Rhynocoris fuscipes]|uniref:Gag protein n=1 Tax=Rhynocoris fuscipes TaxID=488301 RepID=A0AAW1CZS9_9HEMI
MPNTMMANNERTKSGVGNPSFEMSVPTALYQVNPPGQFDFKVPNDLPRWLRRFERFRIASGLQSKTEEQQVNMLVYCMGEEGVADTKLSECLQLDDSFTLIKAIFKARQAENLQKQQPLIRDSTEIEAIGGAISKDVKYSRYR